MSNKELQLKFYAKDSSHFYVLNLNNTELELFKYITRTDNNIILYERAEKENKQYLKELEGSGKVYGNRDEPFCTLYDASKLNLGMNKINDIVSSYDASKVVECKLNGMHIYIALRIIAIIYNSIAEELIKFEDDYQNNVQIEFEYSEFVIRKNAKIECLTAIKQLDIKIREVVNPREITIAELQFANSNLNKIDEICKMTPKS